jgi:hypothetical protein
MWAIVGSFVDKSKKKFHKNSGRTYRTRYPLS